MPKRDAAGIVTAREVAEAAAVSTVTVSRVLNHHANVSERARQRVLKAVAELGYQGARSTEDPADRAPRERQPRLATIGFLFSSPLGHNGASNNPFWSRILHGVEHEAGAQGVSVSYRTIQHDLISPPMLVSILQDMHVDGVLLVGDVQPDMILAFHHLPYPLVLVDNALPMMPIDAVLGDNLAGARAAVGHLIANGHTQIAFIGGPLIASATPQHRPVNRIFTIEQRSLGYHMALLDAGIAIDYARFAHGDLTSEGGYRACKEILARQVPFTAVFCANDETAIGALKALTEAGLRVPDDVSLIGFDDIAIVTHLSPALTTVHVNSEEMGSVAVNALLAQTNTTPPQTRLLNVALVERDSVRAINP